MASSGSPTSTQQAGLFHPRFPGHWDRCPLYSLANWVNGLAFRDISFSPQGLPVIKIAEIKGGISGQTKFTEETFDDSVRVTAGDLLFSWSGQPETSIDAFWWRGPDGWLNQHVFRVTPQDGVDINFLYYLLRYLNRNFVGIARNKQTTGLGHVTKRDLQQIEAAHPEPNEQRAIAGVLGALDDKIQQNRRTARALERLARAIFRAWFVDFEPVRAKAAGATVFPGMPQPVFDTLPTRFVASALGPVPEGWEAGAINDLATLSKTQVNPQESPEEIVDHFSIPAFDAGMRPVVEAGSTIKSNKFLVVDGSVLLSKLNPRIARVWLPPSPCGRKQIASTEFLVFVPAKPWDRHYLYCQFQQTAFREELAQGASGTSNSHQRVRPEDVLRRAVIVPPAQVREAFAGIADPMFAVVSANHDESAKLAAMRDYLLPKLLSGQVRVEAAHG